MTRPEQVETVIVGGGQAGLATGYHLARREREFVILDDQKRTGDNWRRHWDSLRLYSPARYDGLPGMGLPGPEWSYPGKDDVGDYLQAYAERFELPVRHGNRVTRVAKNGDGYEVETDEVSLSAKNVVIATGTFGRPYVPEISPQLDPSIVQLHSSEYRNPAQLREGRTLVVGASHSGADVAHELARSRPTVLCGRDTGQIPFSIESRRARAVFPLLAFAWQHVVTINTPIGRKEKPEVRNHGGPLLRYRRKDLAEAGVERTEERTTGVEDGKPVLGGERPLDVENVVWCTGFRQKFDWIEAPIELDEDGWPAEDRGVAEDSPGVYFVGLSFQRSFSSMLLLGVGRDAEHVAKQIAV